MHRSDKDLLQGDKMGKDRGKGSEILGIGKGFAHGESTSRSPVESEIEG